jgi:hypothetical protein
MHYIHVSNYGRLRYQPLYISSPKGVGPTHYAGQNLHNKLQKKTRPCHLVTFSHRTTHSRTSLRLGLGTHLHPKEVMLQPFKTQILGSAIWITPAAARLRMCDELFPDLNIRKSCQAQTTRDTNIRKMFKTK